MNLLFRSRSALLLKGLAIVGPGYLLATILVHLPPLFDLWAENKITTGTFFRLIPLLIPMLLYLSVPVITAVVVGMAYLGMQERNELVVAQAAGQSPVQLAMPALLFGAIMAAIGYLMAIVLLPQSIDTAKNIEFEARRSVSFEALSAKKFNELSPSIVISFREKTSKTLIRDVVVHRREDGKREETILAKRGEFVTGADGRVRLMLFDGQVHWKNPLDDKPDSAAFMVFGLPLPSLLERRIIKRPKGFFERPLTELLSPPAGKRLSQRERSSWQAEGHKRLLAPFLCLTYALICATVMIFMSGRQQNRWLSIGLMLVLAGGVHSAFIGVTHWIVLYGVEWLPALYFYPFFPAIICLFLLTRKRLRRPRFVQALPGALDTTGQRDTPGSVRA